MTIDKNTESEFINNGFVIPYPDDPFEMKSGPFYLGNQDRKTIVSIRVGRSQCNSNLVAHGGLLMTFCLLYTTPSPRDKRQSRMPCSA